MKKSYFFCFFICLGYVINCYSVVNNFSTSWVEKPSINVNYKEEQIICSSHSVVLDKKPTSQQIYSDIEKRLAVSAELKHNPSTQVKHYKCTLGDKENEISCYYFKNRLIRIENRIFNHKAEIIWFRNFDFDENNNCFSNSSKDENEGSRIYAYILNCVIEYDSTLRPKVIDSSQKEKVIDSVRLSLDSSMRHFTEFKYSMNWK